MVLGFTVGGLLTVSRLTPLVDSLTLVLVYTNIVALIFGQLGRPLILNCVMTNFLTDPRIPLAPSIVSITGVRA